MSRDPVEATLRYWLISARMHGTPSDVVVSAAAVVLDRCARNLKCDPVELFVTVLSELGPHPG